MPNLKEPKSKPAVEPTRQGHRPEPAMGDLKLTVRRPGLGMETVAKGRRPKAKMQGVHRAAHDTPSEG